MEVILGRIIWQSRPLTDVSKEIRWPVTSSFGNHSLPYTTFLLMNQQILMARVTAAGIDADMKLQGAVSWKKSARCSEMFDNAMRRRRCPSSMFVNTLRIKVRQIWQEKPLGDLGDLQNHNGQTNLNFWIFSHRVSIPCVNHWMLRNMSIIWYSNVTSHILQEGQIWMPKDEILSRTGYQVGWAGLGVGVAWVIIGYFSGQ